jgi:hypothetical protein
MVWNVLLSLETYFRNPWIWGFIITLPVLYFIYSLIIRWTSQPAAETRGAGPGCLLQILGLFLQAIGIASILLLLLPVLLGILEDVSWPAVEPLGFVAVRSGLFAMILVTVVSFFPWIGNFIASSPGLETFLLSFLTFRFLSPLYLEALIGKGIETKVFFPPWWIVLILCILTWLLGRLIMILVLKLGKKWTSAVGPSLDILGGILPFLYYARWVAYTVKGV